MPLKRPRSSKISVHRQDAAAHRKGRTLSNSRHEPGSQRYSVQLRVHVSGRQSAPRLSGYHPHEKIRLRSPCSRLPCRASPRQPACRIAPGSRGIVAFFRYGLPALQYPRIDPCIFSVCFGNKIPARQEPDMRTIPSPAFAETAENQSASRHFRRRTTRRPDGSPVRRNPPGPHTGKGPSDAHGELIISRVLYADTKVGRQSFIWDARHRAPLATYPGLARITP